MGEVNSNQDVSQRIGFGVRPSAFVRRSGWQVPIGWANSDRLGWLEAVGAIDGVLLEQAVNTTRAMVKGNRFMDSFYTYKVRLKLEGWA